MREKGHILMEYNCLKVNGGERSTSKQEVHTARVSLGVHLRLTKLSADPQTLVGSSSG